MIGLMPGDRIRVESSGALSLDAVLRSGVREKADINAIASRHNRQISVLVWNYHDDDVAAPEG